MQLDHGRSTPIDLDRWSNFAQHTSAHRAAPRRTFSSGILTFSTYPKWRYRPRARAVLDMARPSSMNRKRAMAARLVIILTSLLILHVTYVIITMMTAQHERAGGRSERQRASAKSSIPDMAELITWGHGGSGVKVTVDTAEMKEGYARHHLNEFVSNRISLRRSLPDMREEECKDLGAATQSPGTQLNASVVVVFRDEPRSVLLRAVFSVLDRTPGQMLKEVILVDQGTRLYDLGRPQLENYLSAVSGKVKVIRSMKTLTYPQALNLGVDAASGSVVVFLSASVECTQGWLQPLLSRISESPYIIAVPLVDTIDGHTFKYQQTPIENITVGSFSWNMKIKRKRITEMYHADPRRNHNPVSIEPTPIIADGMFAAHRQQLISLGSFTASLQAQDISDIEFSLRAWLCGRRVELVPCSRVGLVRSTTEEHRPEIESAKERAEVASWWLGEFQTFVQERFHHLQQNGRRNNYKNNNKGIFKSNIHDKHKHNNDNKNPHGHLSCRDFRWYLRMVEPSKFISGQVIGSGHLSQGENIVLATTPDRQLRIVDPRKQQQPQQQQKQQQQQHSQQPEFWYLTDAGCLRNEDDWCLNFLWKEPVPSGSAHSLSPNGNGDPKQDALSYPDGQLTGLAAPPRPLHLTAGLDKVGAAWAEMVNTEPEKDKRLMVSRSTGYRSGQLARCGQLTSQAQWTMTKESRLLHMPSGQCLESQQVLSDRAYVLRLSPCNEWNAAQTWHFSHVDPLSREEAVFDTLGQG